MWNPFKTPKRKKTNIRELADLSAAFAIITELSRRGLVHWQVKEKMLLIEESLAILKLAEGEEGFRRFLEQMAAWQNFRLIRDDYEQRRIEVETAAVREAQKKYPGLGKADIRRIRQEARSNMPEIPLDRLDVIHEFDILIIRASAPSAAHATIDNGQLLALGHYDGKKVEIAIYEDIKYILLTSNS